MWWHLCGCPHKPYRCAPTPTRCRPDSENVRHVDANLETSTGRMAPCGHTGHTACSGSNMSCRPSGQTLRKMTLRSISASSISLYWKRLVPVIGTLPRRLVAIFNKLTMRLTGTHVRDHMGWTPVLSWGLGTFQDTREPSWFKSLLGGLPQFYPPPPPVTSEVF